MHHDLQFEQHVQLTPAEPLKDSEGTEASVDEIKQSLSQAEVGLDAC